jgi:hypothetical protein
MRGPITGTAQSRLRLLAMPLVPGHDGQGDPLRYRAVRARHKVTAERANQDDHLLRRPFKLEKCELGVMECDPCTNFLENNYTIKNE